MAKFQAAQSGLTQALKSLFAVTENYPELKSDQNFRDLQAQIEGTENRITVARNRYIEAVQSYNITVRSFPTNLTAMLFKHKVKAELHCRERGRDFAPPPTVDFGAAPAPAPRLRRNGARHQGVMLSRGLSGGLAAMLVAALHRRAGAPRSLSRARNARHRSHRHADCCATGGSRAEARRLRAAQGRAGRLADGDDHPARNHRAVFHTRGGSLEARSRSSPTTGCCCSWRCRTARCASKWATASRACCPTPSARRILDDTITPLFRQGDLYGGIDAGLSRIISVVDGEPLPPPDTQWRRHGRTGLIGLLPMLLLRRPDRRLGAARDSRPHPGRGHDGGAHGRRRLAGFEGAAGGGHSRVWRCCSSACSQA